MELFVPCTRTIHLQRSPISIDNSSFFLHVMICHDMSMYFHISIYVHIFPFLGKVGYIPRCQIARRLEILPLGSTEVQIYIALATFNRGLGVLFGGSLGVLEEFPTGFAFFGADSVIPTVFFGGDPKSIRFPVKNNPTMLHHILDWLSSLANTRRRG